MPSSRFLISSQTLASSAASVTFSSIPATYTDLVVRASIRTDNGSAADDTNLTLNSDTTTNYSKTWLRGSGTAADSYRTSSSDPTAMGGRIDGNTATSNTFGSYELYLPNYLSTTSKPIGIFTAQEDNTTIAYINAYADLYRGTSAITTFKLAPTYGTNFLTGSSFYLYGISSS